MVNSAGQALRVGLAGALVGELALDERLDLSGKRIVAVGPAPENPLLAAVHHELAGGRGRRSVAQLRRLDRALGGIWPRLVDGLIEQGVLGRRSAAGAAVPGDPAPGVEPAVRDRVVGEVRAAAQGGATLPPRTAVLLALSGPCRLLEVVAPDRADRAHARMRIETATELTPVAPIVKRVITEMNAAVAAGAVTAATASTS